MKYFLLIVFNIVAVYLLAAVIFGGGGMIENYKKYQLSAELEKKVVQENIGLEGLKSKLYELEKIRTPDLEMLARQGRKSENMVIFKYIETTNSMQNTKNDNEDFFLKRIYFSFILVVLLTVFGNIVIMVNTKRRTE